MITKEDALKAAALYKAYAEGETIQFNFREDGWIDQINLNLDIEFINSYRIKPKTKAKYRPFNDVQECWGEMLEHTPFGWVHDLSGNAYNIGEITKLEGGLLIIKDIFPTTFKDAFKNFIFIDNKPFGKKVED